MQELDSVQLAMYCWTNLEQAARDLIGITPAELFERFLTWTRVRL